MTGKLDDGQRSQATAWAQKAHTYATWTEWGYTLLGTIGGLVGAAAVVMVRAGSRAAGTAEANALLDLIVPGALVLGAGVLGYLTGLLASAKLRFWGHMVRTSASIDERLKMSREG